MRLKNSLLYLAILGASTPAFGADYSYRVAAREKPAVFVGIPAPPPVYIVASPPQYVQDLRTDRPGHWITPQPSLFERFFGERNGY